MTLLEVAQKYGQARSTLSIGDKVLIEGGDSINGNYLLLCEVAEITGTEYFRNLQERARQLRSKR